MVDPCCIRPVALYADETEAFPFDERSRQPAAKAVELRCSVTGFADQHDARIADALYQWLDVRVFDIEKRVAGIVDTTSQPFLARLLSARTITGPASGDPKFFIWPLRQTSRMVRGRSS